MAYKASGAGYADVARHFRTLIQDGELSPGDSLPSVQEIREQFDVSAKTVSRALAVLKREGHVASRGSLGTVVAEQQPTYRSGVARIGLIDRGGDGFLGGETAVEHMAGIRSVDDMATAEALGIDLRDEIAVRTRIFVRDGKRSVYSVSCYHIRAFGAVPELPEQGPLPGQWQKLYTERTGREVHHSPERYSARIATPDELRRLHIADDSSSARAVLVVSTVFHDEEGPLAFWEDVYAPGLSHSARSS
ncbi:GntR family transcriptional regulator [Streptomyces griseoflavus]|uniref:GntR family transcriptional regulator n=1 Tax=Streptomyces griseoflavus TaxID=35619 RepID=UPI00340CF2E4